MPHPIKRALISVYDKTGIVDFAKVLHGEFGIEIISTGGTAALLKKNGIPVTLVEEITGSPEMLDGRVKTLHPKVHGAILADRNNPDHMRQLQEQGIEPIDMVVVNLYPFRDTIAKPDCTRAEAIEMIDIGGPCLLRAAAKNHQHILVVSDANNYDTCLDALRNWQDDRVREGVLNLGGFDAFWTTSGYDAEVSAWLSRDDDNGPPGVQTIRLQNWDRPRYGENPHQRAELLYDLVDGDLGALTLCETGAPSAKDMSFNNWLDANAAFGLCRELALADVGFAACFIKHGNPCGVGIADDPIEAYRRAYLGDPNAAMGGILAVNFTITAEVAEAIMESLQRWGKDAGAGAFFVEVILTPKLDEDAAAILRERKTWGANIRILECEMTEPIDEASFDYKRVTGGFLMQDYDRLGLNEDDWNVVTSRQADEHEMDDLRLAWLICKHTKSNAITICKNGMLIGNGAGQMSRIMSCRIATWAAKDNGHGDKLAGAAAASDAFFPFRDGPDILADAGITAIIQPGGSKRDEETFAAANERGIAMITTGTRHFRH